MQSLSSQSYFASGYGEKLRPAQPPISTSAHTSAIIALRPFGLRSMGARRIARWLRALARALEPRNKLTPTDPARILRAALEEIEADVQERLNEAPQC